VARGFRHHGTMALSFPSSPSARPIPVILSLVSIFPGRRVCAAERESRVRNIIWCLPSQVLTGSPVCQTRAKSPPLPSRRSCRRTGFPRPRVSLLVHLYVPLLILSGEREGKRDGQGEREREREREREKKRKNPTKTRNPLFSFRISLDRPREPRPQPCHPLSSTWQRRVSRVSRRPFPN